MAPPTLKNSPHPTRSTTHSTGVSNAQNRGPQDSDSPISDSTRTWDGISPVARILVGINFLAAIITDVWTQTMRDVFALDPMRPELHQFVSAGFFTFGFVPFLFNSAIILVAGVAIERLIGGIRTFVIYLGAAILGAIGYIVLSSLQWASGPLPAAGIAAAGLLGACIYFRMQVWNDTSLQLLGRWEGGWKELGGIHSIFAGVILVFWATGRYELFTGTVAISHLIGWAGGMVIAAATDLLDHKILPSPPGGSARGRAARPAPFPAEAAVHPFSKAAQSDASFVHETTETLPKKKAAPTPASAPTEVHSRPQPEGPPPPPMDPAIRQIIREIDACNPGNALRNYQAWISIDADRCLDAANQWRLAQLMMASRDNESSITILKKLLVRHPSCFWIAQARAELGFIYSRMPGRRHDAVEQLSASLRVKASVLEDGPQPLSPQAAERVKSTLRDLGYSGSTEKSVATPEPVRDKVPEASIMAKKPIPPAPQGPDPNQAPINTYSNVFGDPDATGNFAPMTLDDEGPAKVPKMYGGDPNPKPPASKASAPPPLPRASQPPPPPLPSNSSDEDPFAMPDQSGVFKQSLWDEGSKKKEDIKYTAPSNNNVDLDVNKPIVLEESTAGSRNAPSGSGLADVFGAPGGTTGLVPPDWSNVAGTGSLPIDALAPPPLDAPPPMPDVGSNSAPFWNRSSPFMFPEEEKGQGKKRATGEDRFNTPPPSSPNLPGSGEKARPLKKKDVKSKDAVDFFPTPVPFTVKGADEDVFNTPAQPIPSPKAKVEDRFATPPPKPAAAQPEPKISKPNANTAPPAAAQPTSHGNTDVWSAFLKEDQGWSDKQPTAASRQSAPVPPPAPPRVQERMIADSAPTVQRPASHPIQEAAPPRPSAPKTDEAIGFVGSSPDQTMVWSRQYANERNLTFNTDSKYNIIIAPASTLMVREIIGMLRTQLGMNEEAALYALKHRHGILLSDLVLDEAVDMCHKFTEQGQDVALVEQDDRLEFGEPTDVMRMKLEEKTARYFTMDAAYTKKWKELVGLSCGRIIIHPGAPGRDVLDLYFAEPGMNLRIWRNTLMSAPPAFTGKMENEVEFQALAKELVKRAPHAIQTQSFIEWTQSTDVAMPVEFSNMVEYQNYTRWYLMAHYGRSKLFGAGKKN